MRLNKTQIGSPCKKFSLVLFEIILIIHLCHLSLFNMASWVLNIAFRKYIVDKLEGSSNDWGPDSGGEPEYEYALFGRTGFKSSLEEAAVERNDLRLFTVNSVVTLLNS